MEHFREGIGLRAYGQRDPLIEYKNEAHAMFTELTEAIQADIVANMFRVEVRQDPPSGPPPRADAAAGRPGRNGGTRYTGPNGPASGVQPVPELAGVAEGKIGRNDPCWCGSGRKYKRCHGR